MAGAIGIVFGLCVLSFTLGAALMYVVLRRREDAAGASSPSPSDEPVERLWVEKPAAVEPVDEDYDSRPIHRNPVMGLPQLEPALAALAEQMAEPAVAAQKTVGAARYDRDGDLDPPLGELEAPESTVAPGTDSPEVVEPVAEAQPIAKAQLVAKARSFTKARSVAEAQPAAEAQPVAAAESIAEAQSVASAQPLAAAESVANAKPVANAESVAEAHPAAETEPVAEGEPVADAERNAEAEQDAEADAEPVAEPVVAPALPPPAAPQRVEHTTWVEREDFRQRYLRTFEEVRRKAGSN